MQPIVSFAINDILFAGAPPASSNIACSLVVLERDILNASFHWSPKFRSRHRVDRYRVLVIPDPNSCSSDQVPPSHNYTCSGLDPTDDYLLIVSAINCGNQEGDITLFRVQSQNLGT